MSIITLLLLSTISYIASSNPICDVQAKAVPCRSTANQCGIHQLCSKRISIEENQWQALADNESCEETCKCYCLAIAIPINNDESTTISPSTTRQVEIDYGYVQEVFDNVESKRLKSDESILLENIWILIICVIFVNMFVLLIWCWCKKWTRGKANTIKSHDYIASADADEDEETDNEVEFNSETDGV
eukprot:56487_1